MAGIVKILNQEVERIKISNEEKELLDRLSKLVVKEINSILKKLKIDASVFVGGSLAKNTIMKKDKYDIDIFLRFNKKYSEEQLKKYMKKIFVKFHIPRHRTKGKRVHGSRNYLQFFFKSNKNIVFEVVPNLRIKTPAEARNITDLSYFHVNYIEKEIKKTKKLADEILLAKSFCHGQKCYGGESYIRGFSGYALEVLISHYKSFRRFLREMVKVDEQIILDPAKHYKKKREILETLSSAKTKSPIILIDPTYKDRNAAAALSKERFSKFKKSAKRFLENPSSDFFQHKKINVYGLREKAMELEGILAVFEIRTKKQPGDIAGSKLLKFSKFISQQLSRYYDVEEEYFEYYDGEKANAYYILKRKKVNIQVGPSIHNKQSANAFKKKHKIWYIDEEDGKIKCSIPTDISLKEFFKFFKKSNKRTMKQMSIRKVKIV